MKVDTEKITALAGQIAQDEMLELVDVEIASEGPRAVIRVFLDREGGIRLGEIESFSRRFGALLEVEDPVQGGYLLEVSSPGLERKLTRPSHYAACRGKRVKVSLTDFVEGSRNFRGILKDSDEEGFDLEREGTLYRIPFRMVRKANVEITQEELFGTGKRKR